MSTLENLMSIISLPSRLYQNFTITSDGYYLGMEHGDIGFNAFLGKPNGNLQPTTIRRSYEKFRLLSLTEKKSVVLLARGKGVNLRSFLVKGAGYENT